MPRRKSQPEPEPAPDFPTDVEYDFTPPTSSSETPSPIPTVPSVPSVPSVPYYPTRPDRPDRTDGKLPAFLTAPDLNFELPDFQSLQPTDLFRPSSSAIPRTDNVTFREEVKVADEQNNSLKLLNKNLDNIDELATAVLKGSRIVQKLAQATVNFAKAESDYHLGMEAVKDAADVGKAKNVAIRSNGFKEVSIIEEKGRHLDKRFANAQIKTTAQGKQNDFDRLELDYWDKAIPIQQETWNLKLDNLKNDNSLLRRDLEKSLN